MRDKLKKWSPVSLPLAGLAFALTAGHAVDCKGNELDAPTNQDTSLHPPAPEGVETTQPEIVHEERKDTRALTEKALSEPDTLTDQEKEQLHEVSLQNAGNILAQNLTRLNEFENARFDGEYLSFDYNGLKMELSIDLAVTELGIPRVETARDPQGRLIPMPYFVQTGQLTYNDPKAPQVSLILTDSKGNLSIYDPTSRDALAAPAFLRSIVQQCKAMPK